MSGEDIDGNSTKRLAGLLVATLLAGIGSGVVTVSKDTSDRFYGRDGEALESRVVTRIDREEVESRLRDTELATELSELARSHADHVINSARYLEKIERLERVIEELRGDMREGSRD